VRRLLGEEDGQRARPGADIQDMLLLREIRFPDGLVDAASLLQTHIPEASRTLPALPDASAVPSGAKLPVPRGLVLPDLVPVNIFQGIYHEKHLTHGTSKQVQSKTPLADLNVLASA
jgi:hypothetical protein